MTKDINTTVSNDIFWILSKYSPEEQKTVLEAIRGISDAIYFDSYIEEPDQHEVPRNCNNIDEIKELDYELSDTLGTL